ncbi:MAG: STAS domain-containing protein [Acidimicrobiales bacterium]
MTDAISWARVVVVWADGTRVVLQLGGAAAPDLATVHLLARLQLAVRRRGGHLRLEDVSSPLRELLELAGLCREVCGQIEGREEALDVEEGVDPGDTVA